MSEEKGDSHIVTHMEEEFIEAFINWIPYEDESREWEDTFFEQYFSQLPDNIIRRIKARYACDYLKSLEPFSMRLALLGMRRLIQDIRDSPLR